ncbi:hypothetical protein TWF281_003536 [Arthrobotrys megalospora]
MAFPFVPAQRNQAFLCLSAVERHAFLASQPHRVCLGLCRADWCLVDRVIDTRLFEGIQTKIPRTCIAGEDFGYVAGGQTRRVHFGLDSSFTSAADVNQPSLRALQSAIIT